MTEFCLDMSFTDFLSYTHGIKTWSWQEAGIYAQCLGETPAKSMVPTNQLDLPMLIKSGRVILGLKKLKEKGKNSNM